MEYETVLNKFNAGNDHRLVRVEIKINRRREKYLNLKVTHKVNEHEDKTREFAVGIQIRYVTPNNEENFDGEKNEKYS